MRPAWAGLLDDARTLRVRLLDVATTLETLLTRVRLTLDETPNLLSLLAAREGQDQPPEGGEGAPR